MAFFRKTEVNEPVVTNNIQPQVTQTAIKVSEAVKTRNKNLTLFDIDTVKYVIEQFPSMSNEIENALLNLSDVLENTINHIEDKSSEVIKVERNFELSQSYRDTSISLYKVAQKIQDYVDWMKEEEEKNKEKEKKLEEEIQKKNDQLDATVKIEIPKEVKETKVEEVKAEEVSTEEPQVELYNDFTGKNPKQFILEDNKIDVEDWDDLIVKLAEVLNRKYRENKTSDKVVKSVKAKGKSSEENDFRDTVIEMLAEYKFSNKELKVIIK